jgi:hypothetical protein
LTNARRLSQDYTLLGSDESNMTMSPSPSPSPAPEVNATTTGNTTVEFAMHGDNEMPMNATNTTTGNDTVAFANWST